MPLADEREVCVISSAYTLRRLTASATLAMVLSELDVSELDLEIGTAWLLPWEVRPEVCPPSTRRPSHGCSVAMAVAAAA